MLIIGEGVMKVMQSGISFKDSGWFRKSMRSMATVLAFVLFFQSTSAFVSIAAQRASKKSPTMTADQRVAHVLSRLTFGARPGDSERVKAMGVEAFINQQLDPDSIDNSSVIAKLRRLPTLGMATPVIIEQYTPPKPVVSPSPAPAKTADAMNAPETRPSVQNAPQLSNNPSMSAMPNEMQADVKKEDAGRMAQQKPEAGGPGASPKP